MGTLLIKNIGEFFTGDIARPQAPIKSLLIDGACIAALDPPEGTKADAVLDAGGSAVMPGLVDGHIHPVFGEWTPTQDTHRLDRQLRAWRHHHHGLGLRTARARARLRESLARSRDLACCGDRGDHRPRALERRQGACRHCHPRPGHDRDAFRPARRGEVDLRQVHLLSAGDPPGRGAALYAVVPRPRHPHQGSHRRRVAFRRLADVRLRYPVVAATGHRRARERRPDPDERR